MATPAIAPRDLMARIQSRTAEIGVVGLGYVGLPLLLTFHRAGFPVSGFDLDPEKIARLNRGESYIRHLGAEAVAAARAAGRFRATGDFSALRHMDAIIVCVPTPLNETQEPDLSFIQATGRTIAQYLQPGQLVCLESSTYPGTTEEVLLPLLEASGLHCSLDAVSAGSAAIPPALEFYLGYSPEREDPGNKRYTTQSIPKLVAGRNAASAGRVEALYASAFEKVVRVSSLQVAEMAKILENTYRAVNIALVNELKQLCLRMGIDIWEVIDAAATKPFGYQPFYPGPGLGGHCIPIDPFYLAWKAKQHDFTARLIYLAGEINTEMPYKVIEAVFNGLNRSHKAVNGARILVLGVAYKKDIDDLRESPALKIIALLRKLGAQVDYHDRFCPEVRPGRQNDFHLRSIEFTPAAAASYDCVLIATDHSGLDYAAIAAHAPLVVDTRNVTRGLHSPHVIRC